MGDIRSNNLFDLLDEDAPVRQQAKPTAAHAPAQQAEKRGDRTNRDRPAAPGSARVENGEQRRGGRGRGGRGGRGRGGRGNGNREPKHEMDRRGVHGAKAHVKKNGAGQFNWDNEQVAQEVSEVVETPVAEAPVEEAPAEIVEEVAEVAPEEDDVVTLEEHLKRIKAPEDDKKQAREVVVDEKAFHKVKPVEKRVKGANIFAAMSVGAAAAAEKKSEKQRKTVSLDEFVGTTPAAAPAPAAFGGERGGRGRGGRGGPRGGRGAPRGAPRGGPRGGPRGPRNNGPNVNLNDDAAFPKLGKN